MMEVVFLSLLVLLASAPVQGLKKCAKIDSCRCSTDEGEINLRSLAGETEDDRPRFNIPGAVSPDVPGQTNDSYQWNPCDSWTAKLLPNETTTNGCKDVAVCKIQETSEFGTFYVDIGEQSLTDCVLKNGQCQLTYGVAANKQVKTTIALVCDENEAGRVDPMRNVFASNLFSTTLYSKCACPGKCSGLSTSAVVGIVIGSVAGFLIFAFVVFIAYLRYKLPSGGPKPPLCTTTKVGCGMIMTTCCPCCKRLQYSSIPGAPKETGPSSPTVNV